MSRPSELHYPLYCVQVFDEDRKGFHFLGPYKHRQDAIDNAKKGVDLVRRCRQLRPSEALQDVGDVADLADSAEELVETLDSVVQNGNLPTAAWSPSAYGPDALLLTWRDVSDELPAPDDLLVWADARLDLAACVAEGDE